MNFPATVANIIRRGGWLLLLLLWGCVDPGLECSDPAGCIAVRASDPVAIASLLDDVNPLTPLHDDIRTGIRLALADRGDELLGHTLIWREWDAGCTAETAVLATQELIADRQIVGAIGTICSESAQGALPLLQNEGIVMISPADRATGEAVTSPIPPQSPLSISTQFSITGCRQSAWPSLLTKHWGRAQPLSSTAKQITRMPWLLLLWIASQWKGASFNWREN